MQSKKLKKTIDKMTMQFYHVIVKPISKTVSVIKGGKG